VIPEIITMCEYGANLYCGAKNGTLSVYDKTTIVSVRNFGNQISRLYSDNNLLYIVLQNSKTIYVYDGKNFIEVTI
jgi:hypothetical protein